MTERLLITKIQRTGNNTADLFGRGHRFADIKVFDLSDLADVSIDYAALPEGEQVPCRFWANYELSEKLNQAGNPYKDLVSVEAIDGPATATSTDSTAIVAELRTIRELLERGDAMVAILAETSAAMRATGNTAKRIPVSVVRDLAAVPASPEGDGSDLEEFFASGQMPAESKMLVPAGEHAGKSLAWLLEHEPGYLELISEKSKAPKVKAAATLTLDWSRSQERAG